MSKERIKDDMFSDELDVKKSVVKIHAEDDELHSDYIYAKLTEKEEKFITEMTINAKLAKTLFTKMSRNLEIRRDEWQNMGFKTKELDKQIEDLKSKANDVFKTYIKRVNLLLAMRRNKKDNYIIEKILENKIEMEEEKEMTEKEENAIFKYAKEKLKKRDE